jgi:hypothetical protein
MVLPRFQTIKNLGLRAIRVYDERNNPVDVDRVGRAIITTDALHAHTHDGSSYFYTHIFTGVANDAAGEILLQTTSSHAPHMRVIAVAGGAAELELFEGTTFSAAGTSGTPRNRNRFKADSAFLTATHTPTVTDAGTSIFIEEIPGGKGGNSLGGSGTLDEVVFKTSENYLLRTTNRSGVAQDLSFVLFWYEPKNGDPS